MDGKARANRPGLLSLRPEAITGTEEDTVAWMQEQILLLQAHATLRLPWLPRAEGWRNSGALVNDYTEKGF